MATGDQADVAARLRALLPKSWFPKTAPNLDASLQGAAWALSSIYTQFTYIKLQTRIKSATDGWLDMISGDFFGTSLPRLTNETDGAFRARILANLFVKGPTRSCMYNVLYLLTGRAPTIFEPSNPKDSGGYDGAAYFDVAGAWGDPAVCQSFVTVYRPLGSSSDLGEFDEYTLSYDSFGYFSDTAYNDITDDALIAAVEATRALGTVVWMRISN